MPPSVAVVGGGIAGVTAARTLAAGGLAAVTLYERQAAMGGRLGAATAAGRAVDLGCTYVKANHPPFLAQLADWERAGCAREWGATPALFDPAAAAFRPAPELKPAGERWMAGAPSMAGLATLSAEERLRVRQRPGRAVTGLRWAAAEGRGRWTVRSEEAASGCDGPPAEEAEYDALILALPVHPSTQPDRHARTAPAPHTDAHTVRRVHDGARAPVPRLTC